MSLNFSYERCKDHKTLTANPLHSEEWHPIAAQLPWIAMICGFGNITTKNLPLVCRRVAQYQALCGATLFATVTKTRVDVYLTDDDLTKFVGFSTNVSPMSETDWMKKLAKITEEQGRRKQAQQQVSAFGMFDKSFKQLSKKAATKEGARS